MTVSMTQRVRANRRTMRNRLARLQMECLENRVVFAVDGLTAVNDVYHADIDQPLQIEAAGVLLNDALPSDTEATFNAVQLRGPQHGTLELNTDGSFDYTPNEGFSGVDHFLYRIESSDATSNVAAVTIYVDNDAPLALNDQYTVGEDNELVVEGAGVLSNDSDDDAEESLTAELDIGPMHGELTLEEDGSFTYRPNDNFHGTDVFTYRAFDGENYSHVVVVEITVTSINDAPQVLNDFYEMVEDEELIVAAPGVLGNDSDLEDDEMEMVVEEQPEHGTLVWNPDGSFTYKPNLDFEGTDTFSYRATDGQDQSDIVVVEILVNAVNDLPVAENDSYSMDEDGTLEVAAPGVLGNDLDADGDDLTVEVDEGPDHGQLTMNPDGSFVYQPESNYHGTDAFSYRAFDGTDYSDVIVVEIEINAVNDAPVGVADSYVTAKGQKLTVAVPGVLGNDSDVENDPLTVEPVGQPAHGELVMSDDGSFEYTPDADFRGTDTFTYQISDGTDLSEITTVTIKVGTENTRPVAKNDVFTTTTGTSLEVSALTGVLRNDTDAEGDVLNAILYRGTRNGALTLNADGSFTYVPTAGFTGTDSFLYRASDGEARSLLAAVTIHVRPASTSLLASRNASVRSDRVDAALDSLSSDMSFDSDLESLDLTTFVGPKRLKAR